MLVRSFVGVDKSTDMNLVNSRRAIDALNYYYRDGVVQKRSGYDELAKFGTDINLLEVDFPDVKTSNPIEINTHINSIHSFVGEDGLEHIVAHIGYCLFEVKEFASGRPYFSPILYQKESTNLNGKTYYYAYKFDDFRSMKSFATGKKMLWFASGVKFVVIRALPNGLTIQQVENNDITFVPTTLTEVTYKNAQSSGRNALDDPNMLNMWRENKLLSGVGKDEDSNSAVPFYQYTLSTSIVAKDSDMEKDMANMKIVVKERGVKQ